MLTSSLVLRIVRGRHPHMDCLSVYKNICLLTHDIGPLFSKLPHRLNYCKKAKCSCHYVHIYTYTYNILMLLCCHPSVLSYPYLPYCTHTSTYVYNLPSLHLCCKEYVLVLNTSLYISWIAHQHILGIHGSCCAFRSRCRFLECVGHMYPIHVLHMCILHYGVICSY